MTVGVGAVMLLMCAPLCSFFGINELINKRTRIDGYDLLKAHSDNLSYKFIRQQLKDDMYVMRADPAHVDQSFAVLSKGAVQSRPRTLEYVFFLWFASFLRVRYLSVVYLSPSQLPQM